MSVVVRIFKTKAATFLRWLAREEGEAPHRVDKADWPAVTAWARAMPCAGFSAESTRQRVGIPAALNPASESRRELAVALYARDLLSLGKAAELAGVSRFLFSDLLIQRNIPRHYGQEELAEDLEYASGE
jgi:predicted HTH domain antitoxin